jgi:hypothetical protein
LADGIEIGEFGGEESRGFIHAGEGFGNRDGDRWRLKPRVHADGSTGHIGCSVRDAVRAGIDP